MGVGSVREYESTVFSMALLRSKFPSFEWLSFSPFGIEERKTRRIGSQLESENRRERLDNIKKHRGDVAKRPCELHSFCTAKD